jgi:hypothetical protein
MENLVKYVRTRYERDFSPNISKKTLDILIFNNLLQSEYLPHIAISELKDYLTDHPHVHVHGHGMGELLESNFELAVFLYETNRCNRIAKDIFENNYLKKLVF